MTAMAQTHQKIFDDFVNGRLAKDEWTHEAHLIACWVTLQDRSPADAIDFLRDAITTHNCGVGTPNTATSGYHETLTRFYVHAVSQADASSPEDLFADPRCDRSAALRHWSRELLFSPECRAAWVEPDQEPISWSAADQGTSVS